ncbi:MAG: dTDP-4-dehydrorhamnose reductase [Paracoccaceae bacterium]
MTILVFGRTGQVGNALFGRERVVSLARSEADLGDPAACAAKIRQTQPSLVINAAAYTAVDQAEDDVELAHIINAKAPAAMAGACADLGIGFLHISTDYVFDGSGTRPWSVGDKPRPLGVYGHSKLAGEQAVAAGGGAYAILRTSWVFSAHGANFVKTMLRLGAERETLSIVADQVGGPTSAGAIADALMQMADRFLAGSGKSGIYHYSGAPDVSWADFVREIFRQSNMAVTVNDISTSQYPTPAARPLNSRLDCGELQRDFGIVQPDWRADLAQVLWQLS